MLCYYIVTPFKIIINFQLIGNMFQGGDLKDQMLKSYIQQIFDKYDVDKSGTLDEKQMTAFFNDLFRSLGMNVVVTQMQALEAIKSIDANFDGTVNKNELFTAFKVMINTPPPPPPPPVQQNFGYNPYGGYPAGYPQPGGYYGGQYPPGSPGYGNYMGQSNPYMNGRTYPQQQQQMYQSTPNGYNGYMTQTNTGYMNQSFQQQPLQNNQPYNTQNSYKK